MHSASRVVILDDRLLIEELLGGLRKTKAQLYTTTYWYYRSCRAAVLGAGGHLSGPFEELDQPEQELAISNLLELRNDILLPDPRATVPSMVAVSRRHPRLNLLNLEAVAAGLLLDARIWLASGTAAGLLPGVLDEEGVTWTTVPVD